jgi:Salmonella virulence plasmid 65kDa B protein
VGEPTSYSTAQNLLAQVTLQTCFGPGQIPGVPGIPKLPSSTNQLSFSINWSEVSGACQYVLERRVGAGAWAVRLVGNATQFAETVPSAGQYSYRLKACNSAANQSQCSAYSPIATVTVESDQPVGFTQPCGLNVASCSLASVNPAGDPISIAWNAQFLPNSKVVETDLSTNASTQISPPGVSPLNRTLQGGRTYRYQLFDSNNLLLKSMEVAMLVPTGQFTAPCSQNPCTLAATGGATQSISLGWATQNTSSVSVTEQLLPSGSVTTLSGASPLIRNNTVGSTYRYRLLNGTSQLATLDVLIAADTAETLTPPQFATAPAEDLGTTAVGATGGSARVDESGSFSYSVPILTGKGVGDFKPVFALNYNSGRGLGRAGMGWDLQGLEAITPCRKSIEAGDGYNDGAPFPDVKYGGNDQFCLNGMRLFLDSGTFAA